MKHLFFSVSDPRCSQTEVQTLTHVFSTSLKVHSHSFFRFFSYFSRSTSWVLHIPPPSPLLFPRYSYTNWAKGRAEGEEDQQLEPTASPRLPLLPAMQSPISFKMPIHLRRRRRMGLFCTTVAEGLLSRPRLQSVSTNERERGGPGWEEREGFALSSVRLQQENVNKRERRMRRGARP